MKYLFVDTNFFIQCVFWPHIKWGVLGGFDDLTLLVCQPVIAELDRHKIRSNDRISRRARDYNSLLGSIIEADEKSKIFNASNPRVVIEFDELRRPDKALADILDYSVADDRIIGVFSSYRNQFPERDTALLTDDVGAKWKARSLGLPFVGIPTEWLLKNEKSSEEKQIEQLKSQLANYVSQSPRLTLRYLQSNLELKNLSLEIKEFLPLSAMEVKELLADLCARVPLKTDFGPSNFDGDGDAFASLFKGEYVPPSQIKIDDYAHAYDTWIEKCHNFFVSFHDELNKRQVYSEICAAFLNEGSMPAEHVLIEVSASPNFHIMPTSENAFADSLAKEKPKLNDLPPPPTIPRGEISYPTGSTANFMRAMEAISDVYQLGSQIQDLPFLTSSSSSKPVLKQRAPDEPFFRNSPPKTFGERYSFEIEMWRHGKGFKHWISIDYASSQRNLRGAIQITITAKNLPTQPLKIDLPLQLSKREFSCYDVAKAQVADFAASLNAE